MNQQPGLIMMGCYKCKKRTVLVRRRYNKHTSDWEILEPPICEECIEKERMDADKNNGWSSLYKNQYKAH